MKIKQKDIIAFLPGMRDVEINSDDNLILQWGLTSVDIIDIVIQIEKKYHIVIEISDLTIENFESINKIIKLIHKYVKWMPVVEDDIWELRI